VIHDLWAALRGALRHADLSHYNAVQKFAYLAVIADTFLLVLSGLAVVTRPETDSEALKLFMAPKGLPPQALAICRDNTPGADYHRVRPIPGDLEIRKPLYFSFVATRLEEQLRERGIDTVVVVGFTTECCVDCTVRDAFHRNFNVFVVADACAAYSAELHQGALNALAANCALLLEADAVLAAWSPNR